MSRCNPAVSLLPATLQAVICLVLAAGLGACGTVLPPAPAEPVVQNTVLDGEEENPYFSDHPTVASEAASVFAQSRQAVAAGNIDAAMQYLHFLVEQYPQLSGPALNLALLYKQGEDYRQAEYWFQQSIARNPRNLSARNQYGIYLRDRGRFGQAEEAYLEALGVWEKYADTHRNLGILYDLYRGDQRRALQHYYRYQELRDSPDRVVSGWIADLERRLGSVARAGGAES